MFSFRHYLASTGHDNLILHIDCWTFLYWRGLVYADQNIMPEYISEHPNGFFVLEKPVEIGLSITKDILYKLKVQEKRKKKALLFLGHDDLSLEKILGPGLGINLTCKIIRLAKMGQWKRLEELGVAIRLTLVLRAVSAHPIKQMQYWFRYLNQIKKIFFTPYGSFVVFIGPDGCGKTTICHGLLNSPVIKKLVYKTFSFHTRFTFFPSFRQIACFFHLAKKEDLHFAAKGSRIN